VGPGEHVAFLILLDVQNFTNFRCEQFKENIWTIMNATLPYASVSGLAMATLNGKAYIFGGFAKRRSDDRRSMECEKTYMYVVHFTFETVTGTMEIHGLQSHTWLMR
jgi:hypothetical protein